MSGVSDNDVEGSVASWKGAAYVKKMKIGHTKKKMIANIARGEGEKTALR